MPGKRPIRTPKQRRIGPWTRSSRRSASAVPCGGTTARRISTGSWRRTHFMQRGMRNYLARTKEEGKLPKAAIFDLDGTLLDSVDLHALAWHEAMMQFGHAARFSQARRPTGTRGGAPRARQGIGGVARQAVQGEVPAVSAPVLGGPGTVATRARCGSAHRHW